MKSDEEKKAHALSLHLYSILSGRTDDGSNASQIVSSVSEFLKKNDLDGHVEIVLTGSLPEVGLLGRTEFGDSMILELYSRCESFPCPAGECEYAPKSFCKMCGKLKR